MTARTSRSLADREVDGERNCQICGTLGFLDDLGACSAECSNVVVDRFMAKGHNHGPDDPPEDCKLCPSTWTIL